VKNILLPPQRAVLHALARQRVLLAFDFDGTLAPIVRVPEAAAMRARTRALLAEVARLYPCVVISGRARADVRKKLVGLPLRAVLGNHGMEPAPVLPAARRLTARWQAQLAAALAGVCGVRIENKGVSLAVHYRQAPERAAARRLVLAATAAVRGARLLGGKMVVNLTPAGAPNKGTAVLGLCKRLGCTSILYLGDDDNDEDAFALGDKARLLGIRVGRSRTSRAAYFVPGQPAVDQLLTELVHVRRCAGRDRLEQQAVATRSLFRNRVHGH